MYSKINIETKIEGQTRNQFCNGNKYQKGFTIMREANMYLVNIVWLDFYFMFHAELCCPRYIFKANIYLQLYAFSRLIYIRSDFKNQLLSPLVSTQFVFGSLIT